MTTLLTVLGFAGLTALSMLFHLRRSRGTPDAGAREGAGGARAHPSSATDCPRCRAPLPRRPEPLPALRRPIAAYELVAAPVATAGPGAAAAGGSPGDSAGSGRLHAVVRGRCLRGLRHLRRGLSRAGRPPDRATSSRSSISIAARGTAIARRPVPCRRSSSPRAPPCSGSRCRRSTPTSRATCPGLYVVGELGGRGLIKNAINEGKIAVEHIAQRLGTSACRRAPIGDRHRLRRR